MWKNACIANAYDLSVKGEAPSEPFQFALPASLFEFRAARPQLPPLFKFAKHHEARTPEPR